MGKKLMPTGHMKKQSGPEGQNAPTSSPTATPCACAPPPGEGPRSTSLLIRIEVMRQSLQVLMQCLQEMPTGTGSSRLGENQSTITSIPYSQPLQRAHLC